VILSCDISVKKRGNLILEGSKLQNLHQNTPDRGVIFLIPSPIKYLKKIAVFVYRFQKLILWRSNWKKQVFSDIIRLE
jgi:hypothetical protein